MKSQKRHWTTRLDLCMGTKKFVLLLGIKIERNVTQLSLTWRTNSCFVAMLKNPPPMRIFVKTP